jgi:hemerythrin-like domain-containing protein
VKRAEYLQPLSREHQVALAVAKTLREAEAPEPAARAFLEFWEPAGKQHFRVEEEVLLPEWAVDGEVDREMVARMLGEHLRIRREALRIEAGDAGLEELRALGQLLHDHVRFEERELFPLVEAAFESAGRDRL